MRSKFRLTKLNLYLPLNLKLLKTCWKIDALNYFITYRTQSTAFAMKTKLSTTKYEKKNQHKNIHRGDTSFYGNLAVVPN
jgi:hypothetical protein